MTRVVLYLRISESDEKSTSLQRQEDDLRKRAAREGWAIAAVLSDDGISGGLSRQKAAQALEMLRSGTADVLAVWKADRWSRQGVRVVADLDDVLAQRPEARFIADQDGLDSREASFDVIFGVLAVIARAERKNTSLRVRSSIAELRRTGRYSGGNLPYGYRSSEKPDGPGRVLVLDEAEGQIVREAANRVLNGESTYAVSRSLNDRQVPTRRGTTWTVQALRQMLTSEAILGRIVHRKEVLRDDDGLPLQVWPPVLDLETWSRLRAALGVGLPRDVRPVRRRRSGLLSGLITCAQCQAPLYLRSNGAGHPAYGCSARSNGRPCDGVSIAAEAVDRYVTDLFLSRVGNLEVMEEVIEAGADEATLAEIERSLAETASEMTRDGADLAALMTRLTALKKKKADLRSAPRETTVRLVSTGRSYHEAWEGADREERQAILSAAVAVLAVRKGRRGCRTFDASRVLLMANPPHASGVSTEAKARWTVSTSRAD